MRCGLWYCVILSYKQFEIFTVFSVNLLSRGRKKGPGIKRVLLTNLFYIMACNHGNVEKVISRAQNNSEKEIVLLPSA